MLSQFSLIVIVFVEAILLVGETYASLIICDEVLSALAEHKIIPTQIHIIKGNECEPKFRIETRLGSYFVKLSNYDHFSDNVLSYMWAAQEKTGQICMPLFTRNLPCLHKQLNVYPWLMGLDLKNALFTRSKREYYIYGKICGVLLHELHSSTACPRNDGYDVSSMLERYWLYIIQNGICLPHNDFYAEHLEDCVLKLNRMVPSCLVHMDFKPKNIMLSEGRLVVIDWDSCIFADPWLDFYDKGLPLYPEKQAFNTGVIDGYFHNTVPASFWQYFKELSIFALIQSAAWAINRKDSDLIDRTEQYLWNSYCGFDADVPMWYYHVHAD